MTQWFQYLPLVTDTGIEGKMFHKPCPAPVAQWIEQWFYTTKRRFNPLFEPKSRGQTMRSIHLSRGPDYKSFTGDMPYLVCRLLLIGGMVFINDLRLKVRTKPLRKSALIEPVRTEVSA
jgi:hypothetical protein